MSVPAAHRAGGLLVLFDIDGTLLVTRGVGKRAFLAALHDVLGAAAREDGVRFAGNTDPRLFRTFCERAGIPPTEERHAAFVAAYRERLAFALDGGRAPGVAALPGVHDVLERLAASPSVTLGLLTGNYACTAPLKLRAVGIDPERFAVQVFGDDGATREDLPPVARQRYEALRGHAPDGAWIVGDTVADVACARAIGWPCLAVATGLDAPADLARAGARHTLPDLGRPAEVLALLGL